MLKYHMKVQANKPTIQQIQQSGNPAIHKSTNSTIQQIQQIHQFNNPTIYQSTIPTAFQLQTWIPQTQWATNLVQILSIKFGPGLRLSAPLRATQSSEQSSAPRSAGRLIKHTQHPNNKTIQHSNNQTHHSQPPLTTHYTTTHPQITTLNHSHHTPLHHKPLQNHYTKPHKHTTLTFTFHYTVTSPHSHSTSTSHHYTTQLTLHYLSFDVEHIDQNHPNFNSLQIPVWCPKHHMTLSAPHTKQILLNTIGLANTFLFFHTVKALYLS